jgi:ribosomal subunit interface protein
MKIDIRNVHLELDDKTRDYAAEKIGRLEKYYKNIVKAEIVLEEHAGDTADVRYGCKTKIALPGNDIFAEEFDKDIKVAIDKVAAKLQSQIVKTKEKSNPSKIHRAKNWVKEFFGK